MIRRLLISPIREFIQDSRAVGITLIVCTAISLFLANSAWAAPYLAFWEKEIHAPIDGLNIPHSILHFINDGLMALFFFLVGLEIKRELVKGELSTFKTAILPIVAAIGGMVVPALFYLLVNGGTEFSHGWGVPMATDIAFSLGILSLLGKRVPISVKIFLTALAIIDDLGAILAIAIFYTENISWMYLGLALGIFAVLILLNLFKVKRPYIFFVFGLVMWYFLFNSGVHATLAGVLLAFTIPMSRLEKLEHNLHDPVSFIIIPIFALANTAIIIPGDIIGALTSKISYGILAGLVLGKPLGIFILSYLLVKLKVADLPEGLNWHHIIGMGIIAGLGFTMSIFIAMLAFKNPQYQIDAKLAVLLASLIAAILGYLYLFFFGKPSATIEEWEEAS